MEKQLSRQQIQEILNQRPKNIPKEDVINGLMQRGYKLEGLNDGGKTENPIKKTLKERATNVVKAGKDIVNAEGVVETVAQAGRLPLRTLGQVAGAAGDVVAETVINPVLQATGADKAIQKGVQTVMDTKAGQIAQKGFESVPEVVRESIGDTLNVAGAVTGTKAVSSGVKAGAGATKSAVKKGGELALKRFDETLPALKRTVTPEEAATRIKENLLSQIEGKTSSIKKLDKTKTDILATLTSDTRYIPEVDAQNKTFNTSSVVEALNEDISSGSEMLRSLFSKSDETYGLIDTNEAVNKTLNKIVSSDNKAILTAAGEAPFKEIQGVLERLQMQYPNGIPRSALWEVRMRIDDTVNSISDTNVRKTLRQQTRTAFEETLEQSIPGNKNLVKGAMSELQKLIEARNYSSEVLNGFKIRGGKLTDIIRNSVATNLGAVAGAGAGGAMGGIPGAAVGYMASEKIGNWLAKNTLSTAADRRALLKLKVEQPTVWKDLQKYIDDLNEVDANKVRSNLKLLEQKK